MTRTPLVCGEDGRLYVLFPGGSPEVPPVRRLFADLARPSAVVLRVPPPRLEKADLHSIVDVFKKLLAYQSAGSPSGVRKE
ncbi:MAG: hypothetical protein IPK13_20180 [Deltaproteobacteria bacterium]|nr:hypothetical protein [Deltaproteobacteria bacterium]